MACCGFNMIPACPCSSSGLKMGRMTVQGRGEGRGTPRRRPWWQKASPTSPSSVCGCSNSAGWMGRTGSRSTSIKGEPLPTGARSSHAYASICWCNDRNVPCARRNGAPPVRTPAAVQMPLDGGALHAHLPSLPEDASPGPDDLGESGELSGDLTAALRTWQGSASPGAVAPARRAFSHMEGMLRYGLDVLPSTSPDSTAWHSSRLIVSHRAQFCGCPYAPSVLPLCLTSCLAAGPFRRVGSPALPQGQRVSWT